MSELDKVYSSGVKYSGIFDYKGLYNFLKNSLKEKGYDVFEEQNYGNKIQGKIKIIKWKCEKKITDYFKSRLSVKISGDIQTIKAKKGRKKINTQKGNINIKVTGVLVKDYEGDWEGKPLKKFFREVYDSWIISGRVRKYKAEIRNDVEKFLEDAKGFLSMEKPV